VLVQQVLGIIEGFFELLEPCLQLVPMGTLLCCFNHQVKLWQDSGLQFLELPRHVHAEVG